MSDRLLVKSSIIVPDLQVLQTLKAQEVER